MTQAYDAFGVEEDIDAKDVNPFRYCAEYFNKETGRVYLRARYYVPSLGRFMSEDAARDGLNFYTYCKNSPISYIDPTGYFPNWNDIKDWGGSFKDGFTDYFKDRWEGFKSVFNDLIGSYVDYMTQLWSHPIKNNPLVKTAGWEINTITSMWQDIFNQDYNSLAYGFGNRAAMGLEMVITAKIISVAQGKIGTGAATGASSNSSTTLYRAVSEAEYSSIMNNGNKFFPYDYAMEQKWFATTSADATAWGKLFYADSSFKIIEVNVPTSSLEQFYYAQKLDGIGPAYCGEIDLINSIMKGLKLFK